MDLLEHLVDVDAVGFLPPSLLLLVTLSNGLLGLSGLLGGLSRSLRRHTGCSNVQLQNTTAFFRGAFI